MKSFVSKWKFQFGTGKNIYKNHTGPGINGDFPSEWKLQSENQNKTHTKTKQTNKQQQTLRSGLSGDSFSLNEYH